MKALVAHPDPAVCSLAIAAAQELPHTVHLVELADRLAALHDSRERQARLLVELIDQLRTDPDAIRRALNFGTCSIGRAFDSYLSRSEAITCAFLSLWWLPGHYAGHWGYTLPRTALLPALDLHSRKRDVWTILEELSPQRPWAPNHRDVQPRGRLRRLMAGQEKIRRGVLNLFLHSDDPKSIDNAAMCGIQAAAATSKLHQSNARSVGWNLLGGVIELVTGNQVCLPLGRCHRHKRRHQAATTWKEPARASRR